MRNNEVIKSLVLYILKCCSALEWQLHGAGVTKEIPHVQGQRSPSKCSAVQVLVQQLSSAGATLRRYLTSKGKGEALARW